MNKKPDCQELEGRIRTLEDENSRLREQIQALCESEECFRLVTETANEGIVLQSANGEILTWNRGAEKIFGIPAEEVIGRRSSEREWPTIHEDGSRYGIEDHPSTRTLRTGNACINEVMGIYRPSGELRWVSINTNPLFRHDDAEPYAVTISFSDITALKKEKDLSQKYLDVAGVMLVALNEKGKITLANKQTCATLEFEENELLGMNWFEHFLPLEAVEKVDGIFKRLMAGDIEPVEYAENWIRTRTGKEKRIAWRNSVLRAANGKIIGILSSGEDITARNEADALLRESEEKLDALINAVSESVFLIDRNGKVLAANETGALRLGFKRDEIIGLPLNAYTPPDLVGSRMEVIQKAASTGEVVRFSDERDGMIFESTVWPIANAEGQINRLAVVAVDVTRQRAMAASLKIKEFGMESATSAIAIADSDFRLTYVNSAFLNAWGFDEESEVLGVLAYDFWEAPDVAQDIAGALKCDGRWFGELTALRKDGSRFIAQVSANAVLDRRARMIAFMGYFVDITSIKETEKDLREKTQRLQEANTALKVLMDHRDVAKEQLAENVLAGVNTLIRPYLKRIREGGLTSAQETLADVLESHLKELTAPLTTRLSARYAGITPREIEIAGMIREGRTSDEIADCLNISRSAVVFHRQNLRKKLGLKGQKRGLRSHLQEMLH